MSDSKRKKVVCPIEGKDGKTYWRVLGNAWVNKDNSINVYMDCTPLNWDGKLQVRDYEDTPPAMQTHEAVAPYGNLRPISGAAGDARNEELPF